MEFNNKIKLHFDNNLWDSHGSQLVKLCTTEGLFLMDAPAGTGKTYGMDKAIREAFKLDNDRPMYLLSCPNRIQNQQNASYGLTPIVGTSKDKDAKKIDYKSTHFASMVYEKASEVEEALKEIGRDAILIIDEAHQLIEANNYRNKAITDLEIFSQYAKTVIHMTATPRKCLEYYNYDLIVKFEPNDKKAINNMETLKLMETPNVRATVLSLVRENVKNGLIPVVEVNDKNEIEKLKKVFDELGYSTGILTSTDEVKMGSFFKNITENSLIPEGIDIVLTTSMLECGTNLKNTNIVPIYACYNRKNINTDSIIQFMARPRKKISLGMVIVPVVEELVGEFKPYEDIKNQTIQLAKAVEHMAFSMNMVFNLQAVPTEQRVKNLKQLLKDQTADGKSLGQGLVTVNDDATVEINQKGLINKAFKDFDNQYIGRLELLADALVGHVKADEIIVEGYAPTDDDGEKLFKELNKGSADEKREKAKEILFEFVNDTLAIDSIGDGSLEVMLGSEDRQKIKFLKEQKTVINKYQELRALELDTLDHSTIVVMVSRADSFKELDHYAKSVIYSELNRDIKILPSCKVKSNYMILRELVDSTLKSNGRRLTKKKINEVMPKLMSKAKYNKYLNSDKEQQKKQYAEFEKHLLNELSLICTYELENEKYIRLNSLIKADPIGLKFVKQVEQNLNNTEQIHFTECIA